MDLISAVHVDVPTDHMGPVHLVHSGSFHAGFWFLVLSALLNLGLIALLLIGYQTYGSPAAGWVDEEPTVTRLHDSHGTGLSELVMMDSVGLAPIPTVMDLGLPDAMDLGPDNPPLNLRSEAQMLREARAWLSITPGLPDVSAPLPPCLDMRGAEASHATTNPNLTATRPGMQDASAGKEDMQLSDSLCDRNVQPSDSQPS
eukprot:CAMPEP_0175878316 /NCGR_PEP_ID=MMETSP0107_2-20121207/41108_1 /TAXON_ID=195067 ORGANISM="Goniomonas pacifica, Strain CCMP1869" /NCGR_SAMPLE_ID=MMETSP0107_2 /ASSEMBLY_ACC=CAM_ASM_000203 /LENGTH=200 /DNA_ID=CAMNT_0017197763 /DNA_START=150 /DNA_END=752 /DNA_ORIENTATION=-